MVEVGERKLPVKENSGVSMGDSLMPNGGAAAAVKLMSKIDTVKRPPDAMLKLGSAGNSALQEGDELMLEVTCGQNQALLYMSRLQLGSKGTCVLFDNSWLTPNEFQYVSGRETAKDWKRSIKHHGKSLKVLIAKGILTTNPLRCNCGQCSQMRDKSTGEHKHASPAEDTFSPRLDKELPAHQSNLVPNKISPGSGNCYFKPGDCVPAMTCPPIMESPQNLPKVPSHLLDPSASSCRYTSVEDPSRNISCQMFHNNSPRGATIDMKDRSNNNIDVKVDDKTCSSEMKSKSKKSGNKDCDETDRIKDSRREMMSHDERSDKYSTPLDSTKKLHTSSSSTTSNKPSSSHLPSQNHSSTKTHSSDSKQPTWHTSAAADSSGKVPSTDKSAKKQQLTPSSSDRQASSSSSITPDKYRGLMSDRSGAVDGSGVTPASEAPYVFPPYGAPCYPMVPTSQLPIYYPNPYILPMPFPTTPAFPYGWTAPSDMMTSPSCMMSSSSKDVMDRRDVNPSRGSAGSSIFNFPWMKRPDVGSSYPTDQQQLLHGKRKLEDDVYTSPAKHPYYFPDGSRPSLIGDWPQLYNPSIDFRLMPSCDLSSCIPDGRNLLANSYLKASENHMSTMNLYPSLYPSPYVGISSR